MPIDPHLREQLQRRHEMLEEDAGRLLRDILRARGGDPREARRVTDAKIQVAMGALEDLLYSEPDSEEERIGRHASEIDELIVRVARMDADRRRLRREEERLQLEKRELGLRHQGDELRIGMEHVQRIVGAPPQG